MATIAFDEPYDGDAAKPPISLHPAFPAIVALWFAALLGLGSLVVPAVLLDRLVALSGIASLIPAANPPLGFTARALLAIAAAVIGTGLGIVIARRVARMHRPRSESRVAKLAGGSRRPIRVHEELGGEGVVNGEGLPISRRRALAISEDERPSDFLYQAPLPGAEISTDSFASATAVGGDDEPLELSDIAEDEAGEAALPVAPAGEMQPDAEEYPAMTDRREFEQSQPFDAPMPEASSADELGARNNRGGPRGLEPLPFSAPSLARVAPEPEPEREAELEVEVESGPVMDLAAPREEEATEARADWATAPLEGLGLVQLVQRLGSTIERRREAMARSAFPVASAAPASFARIDFEPAPAEEAVQAMAAYFGTVPAAEPAAPPPAGPETETETEASSEDQAMPVAAAKAQPAFLRSPIFDEEDEDDDFIPDFTLPLRRAAVLSPSPLAGNDDASEPDQSGDESVEEEDDDGYSSLLELHNPFAAPKGESVRIEEPEPEDETPRPAVIFPGQGEPSRGVATDGSGSRPFDPPGKSAAPAAPAPHAAEQTDAALRAALATLQRMSGAA